jgi:RND family efflux transporter MFP subunit
MISTLRISAFLLVFAAAAFAGGGKEHGHGDTREHSDADNAPTVAVTQWTERMELFMEYPVLTPETHGRFIIHLTVLEGFQPVRGGRVTLIFSDSTGHIHTIETEELLREGIFSPEVGLHEPGRYDFTLKYEGNSVSDEFHIEGFVVYPTPSEIPRDADETAGEEIGFLKEQQWKVPFATAVTEVQDVKRAVWAIGEVIPSPSAYAEIVAPVDGIVQIAAKGNLALPGSTVQRGDVVATITPPVQGEGWVTSRLAYEQAKRDFERAERLREFDAISQREYELARNEYRSRKARFESVADGGDVNTLALTAPIHGQIMDWMVRPGQLVRSGDKLMAVVDPSVVWLKVNVYENDFKALGRPVGVFIHSHNESDGQLLTGDDFEVLTTGGALNPATRTIPVLLEIRNETNQLTINESTPVELYSSKGDSAIAVPKTAVYEDEGISVVFVQTGGESFEKRQVTLGPRYGDRVSVLEGLSSGERYVSVGGYHVRLASTSAEIGHGHAH